MRDLEEKKINVLFLWLFTKLPQLWFPVCPSVPPVTKQKLYRVAHRRIAKRNVVLFTWKLATNQWVCNSAEQVSDAVHAYKAHGVRQQAGLIISYSLQRAITQPWSDGPEGNVHFSGSLCLLPNWSVCPLNTDVVLSRPSKTTLPQHREITENTWICKQPPQW